MKKNTNQTEAATLLRRKAEELLKKKPSKSLPVHSEAETLILIHELEVHQIELEMQNEELVLAKEQAELAAEKLAALYDFAPSGYFTLSEDGTIIELNLSGAEMLGKDRQYLKNKRLGLFLADDTRAIYNQFLEKTFRSRVKEFCEVTISVDGKPSEPVYLSGIASGNAEQCFVTMLDISERKQMEAAIQKSQKLESIGLVAGGIAHNFNNLMGGIFGYIEIAIEATKEDEVTKNLSKALNTMDRAKGLTAQLLTFAKGGGPKQINTPLIPFVKDAAQITLSRLNIPCTFDIAGDLWPCSIDKIQIAQVFDNIITNAQQAMPNGGSIDLTAMNVSLEENEHPILEKGCYVRISIRDFGIGIQKESLPLIFDPFYTTRPTGQGLGLSVCNSIVNRHGGALDVESEVGKGSIFHIYLPALSENVSSSISKSTAMSPGASGTFLIMDDEEVMRETTTIMLESLGYSVISKDNGRDTVDFYIEETKANRCFAGLILDLTIPHGMGGKATAAEIRKLNTEIPIFVSSGYVEDPVMKDPVAYGFTACIGKPFRKSELLEILNKYVKK
jgi:two-component system, cell cycle sensor histidine kinase and response regulator CckA